MRETSRIRPIELADHEAISLVAARMRATLVEVLGEVEGTALYDMTWLVERVRWHLDPDKSTARVLVSVSPDDGHIEGHSIVRVELDERGDGAASSGERGEGAYGLFSTTYVEPASRRRGVASRLLCAGEAWMVEHALPIAATHTAATNHELIALYRRHGYETVLAHGTMVRLERSLASPSRA